MIGLFDKIFGSLNDLLIDWPGKPAAADLQLGLATAPVLFAARRFPELELLINRRFNQVMEDDIGIDKHYTDSFLIHFFSLLMIRIL